MYIDAVTNFTAIISFFFIGKIFGIATALLQAPALLMNNFYVSKYYQIFIGVLSTLLQVYLLCCIPAYYFSQTSNLNITFLSFVLIFICILTSYPNDEKKQYDYDIIGEYVSITNFYTKLIVVIPTYILLCSMPGIIDEIFAERLLKCCYYILHIPIIGFIVKTFSMVVAGYMIFLAIFTLGALVYKLFEKE